MRRLFSALCLAAICATGVAAPASTGLPPPCRSPACSVVAKAAPWPTARPGDGPELLVGPLLSLSLPAKPIRIAYNDSFLGLRLTSTAVLLLEDVRLEELTSDTHAKNGEKMVETVFEHTANAAETAFPDETSAIRNLLHYKKAFSFSWLKMATKGNVVVYWGKSDRGWTAIVLNRTCKGDFLEISGRGSISEQQFETLLASIDQRG